MAARKAAKTKAAPASGSDAERAALLAQADQAPIRYDPVLVAESRTVHKAAMKLARERARPWARAAGRRDDDKRPHHSNLHR